MSQANYVIQDKAGFLWLGGNDGMMRYDGHNIVSYTSDPDNPNSLSNNLITRLFEDDSGLIWITTVDGLNRFDPRTKQFTRFKHDPDSTASIASNVLYSIRKSHNHLLWLATANGINQIDPRTGTVTRLEIPQLSGKHVRDLFEDNRQRLWISVVHKGLYRYDLDDRRLTFYQPEPHNPTAPESDFVGDIHQTRDGRIWIGAVKYLLRYNETEDNFVRYKIPIVPVNKYGKARVAHLFEDSRQRLWLTTLYNGIAMLRSPDESIKSFASSDGQKRSFDLSYSLDALETKDGTMIFTSGQGLLELDRHALIFEHLQRGTDPSLLNELFYDGQSLWISLDNSLYKLSRKDEQPKLIFDDAGMIQSITQDSTGRLIVGLTHKGLFFIDKQTGKLSPHPINRLLLDSPSIDININKVCLDSKDNVWLGLYNDGPGSKSGVYKYDKATDKLSHYLKDKSVQALLPLQDSVLAATYQGGLTIIRENASAQVETIGNMTDVGMISNIFQDKSGRIWLATMNSGLGHYFPETGKITFLNQDDGMPSNSIRAIIAEQNGLLWLGSQSGLIRFDPEHHKIKTYSQEEGLRLTQFSRATLTSGKDQNIWMADSNLLVHFDTKALAQIVPPQEQPVLLTDFRLLNRSVVLRADDPGSRFDTDIQYLSALTLSHEDSLFSISFSGTDFGRADRTRYAYRLKGLNDQWIETDSYSRTATFTSLPAGNYRFQVKTTRSDGSWSSQYRSLDITITPPWYLTPQAYAAYVLLFVLSVYGFIRIRTERLVRQAKILEKTVDERTEQLRLQSHELQQSRDQVTRLLSQKEQTFADISHEIKTPLTLILSPLESLLGGREATTLSPQISAKLTMMRRNGKRLLRLVEQILELSRLDSNTGRQQQHCYSLKQVLSVLLSAFEPLLLEKSLTLEYDDFEDVRLVMDTDALETIFTNLLSNAVKYTPKGGTITVNVSPGRQSVTVTITDNGIGMTQQQQQWIFDRFTRARETHGEHIPGTGIGLALVKRLVENHQGIITVDSEQGRGSSFSVTLPSSDKPAQAQNRNDSADTALSSEIQTLSASPLVSNASPISDDQDDSPTILLIDDNTDMLQLLKDTLEPGYRCLSATDGSAGLDIAREQIPDIILCDVMMPGLSGFEVARALKQDELTCHIPVVLLTAKGDVESRMEGWKQDIDDYLDKPFHPQELRLRLDSLLSIRHLLQKRFMTDYVGGPPELALDPVLSDKDRQFITRLKEVLAHHYSDSEFSRENCAALLGISERQLSRKLSALLNESFPELLRDLRLEQAAHRMTSGRQISQISDEVGFATQAYFGKCFKAKYGKTPKQYQSDILR